jgi:uncharacterized protein (TIGR00369 family)
MAYSIDNDAEIRAKPSPLSRVREYEWTEPNVLIDAAKRLGGLDLLREIGEGILPRPPVLDTLAIDPVSVKAGSVTFEMTPQRWHYNPLGSVHGGVLATLADTALGCAVHSRLPAGTGYTTLEVKLNFVRPVLEGTGRIRCEAEILSLGRKAATAQARITDDKGKLYAHATTTCLIFPIPADT